jgi:hypothetical protein
MDRFMKKGTPPEGIAGLPGGVKVGIIALLFFSVQHSEILTRRNNRHLAMTSIGIHRTAWGDASHTT